MTKTAAAYVRISQDRQGQALGVGRQRKDCEAFIRRQGWTLAEVYVDNDVSAFSGKVRPGYERLIRDLKDGQVNAVVAWHPDRLHRSPRELEDFIDLIDRQHTTVATVTAGDYDLSTPEGRLMARIVGSVARKESEDKSRRLRRKHEELAESGRVSGGGRRPFGYESDRRTIRESEAALVREAAGRVLAGESLTSILNDWRDRSIPTVTGAHWSSTTMKRMLQSGRISGQREHGGRIVADAEWPALITPAETEALRAILSDPSRDRSVREPRSYVLSGFVWCGRCGTRMTTRPTGQGVPRYVCAKARGGCGKCGIAAKGLEELVIGALLEVIDTQSVRRAVQQGAEGMAAIDTSALMKQLADDQRILEALAKDYYVDQVISRDEYFVARGGLEEKMDRNRSALSEILSPSPLDVVGEGGPLEDRWIALTMGQQRAVVRELVDRIVIAPTTRANNKFDPTRVDVEWKA